MNAQDRWIRWRCLGCTPPVSRPCSQGPPSGCKRSHFPFPQQPLLRCEDAFWLTAQNASGTAFVQRRAVSSICVNATDRPLPAYPSASSLAAVTGRRRLSRPFASFRLGSTMREGTARSRGRAVLAAAPERGRRIGRFLDDRAPSTPSASPARATMLRLAFNRRQQAPGNLNPRSSRRSR